MWQGMIHQSNVEPQFYRGAESAAFTRRKFESASPRNGLFTGISSGS
jgi:hypothetical protein